MQLEGTNVRLQTFVLVFASLRSRVLNTIGVDTSTLFAINGVPAVLVCDASVGLQWRCWSWLSHDCGVACLRSRRVTQQVWLGDLADLAARSPDA